MHKKNEGNMQKKCHLKVTITGADDAVKPSHLLELSREYPFLEWGILFSETRVGSPRYPSKQWITRLDRLNETTRTILPIIQCWSEPQMHLSAHLCGSVARIARVPAWRHDTEDGRLISFDRMQINGFSGFGDLTGPEKGAPPNLVREGILQCRDFDRLRRTIVEAGEVRGRCSVLFDASGGRGISPESWPTKSAFALGSRVDLGYAGGIGPDNVQQVLDQIREANGGELPFGTWIDMESGARDGNDRFSLDKVESVLRQADMVFTAGP